jgi:cell division septum initiation protein DivIVA
MLHDMDLDELQHALGAIVLESAYLERTLRAAFSALVGSKYAAVIDGRWAAAALIEDCEQIIKHHTDIAESARQPLLTALRACHEANRQRNRVIHDAWATGSGDAMVTLQGARKSHDVRISARTLAEVRQLADEVGGAADELKAAMTTALGRDWVLIEDELRNELGHDISTDLGS